MRLSSEALSLGAVATTMLCSSAHVAAETATTFLSVTINPNSFFCGLPSNVNKIYSSSSEILTSKQTLGNLTICTNVGEFYIEASSANKGYLKNTSSPTYGFKYNINSSNATADAPGTDIYNKGTSPGTVHLSSPQTIYSYETNGKGKGQQLKCDGNGKGKNANDGCSIGVQWEIVDVSPAPSGIYTDTITFTLID